MSIKETYNKIKKKTYNQWSLTRRIFFWIAIGFGMLTILFFIVQSSYSLVSSHNLNDNLEEIKNICMEDVEKCDNSIIREKVYVADELRGTCPYSFVDIGNSPYFLSEGSLQFWVKLERLSSSFFQNEDIVFGNITMGVEGKIGNAFRYQGLKDIESNKRYLVEYLDFLNKTFLQLYITDNKVVSFRIFDSQGREFVLSYNNPVPINEWTQIIVTWDDEINLFVNGEGSKNKIITGDTNFNQQLSKYYFGSSSKEKDCLNGLLDEIGIWGRKLDYSEVKQLYNKGEGLPFEEF